MGIHEECGVFGIISAVRQNVAGTVYHGLYSLQHRGQEGCGMVVNDDGVFVVYKDLGLVGEVFSPDVLAGFPRGNMAIGHVRYGTTGETTRNNCQPLTVNHQKGKLAVAHNGNLVNALMLRDELELSGAIFHTTSDTETICYLITRERMKCGSIEEAVSRAVARLEGAYSLCVMSATKMIAVRDPQGFRPLVYGKRADGSYVVASESCALDAVNVSLVRDVLPGEMIVFSCKEGIVNVETRRTMCERRPKSSCIFEYIYFSRPDSVIDGVSVHAARTRAGEILASEFGVDADVVIGVPDSGIDAAIGYSGKSHIPYETGLVKNKYVGRSFIAPVQDQREDMVRIKLSPIRSVLEGKRVILIDDSIVRGTTSRRIAEMIRAAGATQVHLRISSPAFRHPCFYGVDIDSEEYLIANKHTNREMAEMIGVDSLEFLPLYALSEMTGGETFCSACFDGRYPTIVPSDLRKDRFERKLMEVRG